MDSHALHQKYLVQGTAGFMIIRRFFSRYSDLLARANFVDINDIVHEVYVSLSKTDFAKVQNAEHYIMRAIKLHCWSLLDKAMRLKAVTSDKQVGSDTDDPSESGDLSSSGQADHLTAIEGMELLSFVNLFKAQLNEREARLLNLLIDETERMEIARLLGLNLNTLDTSIRRLRIRLSEFLRNLGYTFKALDRFR